MSGLDSLLSGNPNRIKLSTISDDHYRNLHEGEPARFTATMLAICWAQSKRRARLVYRGVDHEYLKERFGMDGATSANRLLDRLFYFGDKARHFMHSTADENGRRLLKLRSINETGSQVAQAIFSQIQRVLRTNRIQIQELNARQPEFREYFEDDTNSSSFVHHVEMLGERATAYYMGILHTTGRIGTSDESPSLSTTLRPSVAANFAANSGSNRYIIVAVDRYARRTHLRIKLIRELRLRGLPALDRGEAFYPQQMEITFWAGLLPHDLLGVLDCQTEQFIVNPHLFSTVNQAANLATNPLQIDQSDFEQLLALQTRYSRYFLAYGDGRIAPGPDVR